jgi:hypothetical protein
MKFYLSIAIVLLALGVFLPEKSAQAQTTVEVKHGPQGTGNYKNKKKRHEKPGPENEKKKKSSKWLKLRQK